MANMHAVVRSLLIPIHSGQLLLPSAVIAEVTAYTVPDIIADTQPDWLLGMVTWRNQHVPLLSIEQVLGLPVESVTADARIVVLYGLESPQTMPFYAFIASDIPSALAVNEESLTGTTGGDKQKGLVFSVTTTEHNEAFLPDLTYLENLLRKSQVVAHLA